jgi:tetratricopeptide (TPR) repeat protein
MPVKKWLPLTLVCATATLVLAQDQPSDWVPPPPRSLDAPAPAPAAAPAAQPAPAPPAPPAAKPTVPLWVGIGGGAFIAALALASYQFIVAPRKRRRSFLAALELLANDSPNLNDAERLLSDALISGMGRKDVAAARFALAYVRARLNRYAEAAAVLADLKPNDRDRESVYLELWLHSKLKAHERVEAIYRDYAELLDDLRDTRLLVGIAYLERARLFWASKQISSAVEYFKKLRDLGVRELEDEIPEHIDDHQVVLGIAALFEKNFEQAGKHFRGAVEAAGVAGKSAVAGRLGELLCQWRATGIPQIDEPLGELTGEMAAVNPAGAPRGKAACPHCGHEYQVANSMADRRAQCKNCRRAFRLPNPLKPLTEDAEDADLLLSEEELLLRNVLLWHAASLLFAWRGLTEREGLPAEEFETLCQRLEAARHVDPDFADAQLMQGLIAYFFAPDEEARTEAVKGLERAIELGVSLPEVLNLVEREKRLEQYRADSLARFFAHVQDYLGNRSVPEELRQELHLRLSRYQRFREIPPIDPGQQDEEAAPSLSDLRNRSQVLRDRVQRVQRRLLQDAPDGTEVQAIDDLVGDLEKNTQELVESAKRVEDVELDLMASTSEFLLKEEEAAEPETADQ